MAFFFFLSIEGMHNARCGKEHKASSPCACLSPNLHVFIDSDALWTQSFLILTEASWHRPVWLNHWSVTIDSTSNSFCLPGGQDVGLKVLTLSLPLSLIIDTVTDKKRKFILRVRLVFGNLLCKRSRPVWRIISRWLIWDQCVDTIRSYIWFNI